MEFQGIPFVWRCCLARQNRHQGRINLFSYIADHTIDAPLCRKSPQYIQAEVVAGRAEWITVDSARILPPVWLRPQRELLGHGNLLPFTRVPNKMKKPHPLHYQIPAVGARSRPQWCRQINKPKPATSG